ncbi:hypothetical protein BHE74_00058982 [Ensete ventricosum]|uniref:Uncharacterized protein n=1 Tax=Ensete ventricosum TaxID=4639 RepID=A0A426XMZ2_ENSVE|nr:hypothetical protein B296_00058231 [Ensete ventricosum]RWV85938.1 hypothetical protein GW17_00052216 [Ensete ventricosum]RWW36021.1 hypothetical protein BHE74_00058982 [Ensete ventricosum]RZS28898.1 hypothetical protein BHM03_00062549 [Ensete ventricosum]
MSWAGRVACVTTNRGARHQRSLLWRIRTRIRNAIRKGSRPKVRLQYDPFEYALNFDDGFYGLNEAIANYRDIRNLQCG